MRPRNARERRGEAERAGGRDHPPAAIVREHREDVADDRTRRARDEHDTRLGVRQAEIGPEGLERAVRKEPCELVDETHGEQREHE